MKFVVDTNVLISALLKDSLSRKIILHINAKLITPQFLEDEITKHKKMLLRKGKFSDHDFNRMVKKLMKTIAMVDDDIVSSKMEEAREIMDKIDWKDTPFIAAALATGADIWSDDKHFGKQRKVKVWKTKDMLELL